MKWITRPKEKPMPITKYIDTMDRLYGKDSFQEGGAVAAPPYGTELDYIDPKEIEDIKKQLKVSPLVKEPKKIIKKEIKVVKKAKPKPVVPDWDWQLGDWTDLLDEDVPPPPVEDIEKVLNIKKKEVAGLEAILNFHKRNS